jgi:hypothetical protein
LAKGGGLRRWLQWFFYHLFIYLFLVITPHNYLSEFKLSRRLCEQSRHFLDSRATRRGAYISPPSWGSHACFSSLVPPLRTKPSLFGFSPGFSLAQFPRLGLRPSSSFFIGSYSLLLSLFFALLLCVCIAYALLFSLLYYFLFLGFHMELAWIDVE